MQLVTYRGVPVRQSADFSKEALRDTRDWQEICKVIKSKGLQPQSLYKAKLSFRIKEQIKNFPDQEAKGVHHHQTNIV